jgi:drug/metabolite transporter (DMT)-like permease
MLSTDKKKRTSIFRKQWLMKYKILGAALAFMGLILIAKYNQNLMGMILIFAGVYLGMKKGMKPK